MGGFGAGSDSPIRVRGLIWLGRIHQGTLRVDQPVGRIHLLVRTPQAGAWLAVRTGVADRYTVWSDSVGELLPGQAAGVHNCRGKAGKTRYRTSEVGGLGRDMSPSLHFGHRSAANRGNVRLVMTIRKVFGGSSRSGSREAEARARACVDVARVVLDWPGRQNPGPGTHHLDVKCGSRIAAGLGPPEALPGPSKIGGRAPRVPARWWRMAWSIRSGPRR